MSAPEGLSIAPDADPFALDPDWVRLDGLVGSQRLTGWRIDRGRSTELDKTETGTSVWDIIDKDGHFDPTVPGGDYAGSGQLDPMTQAIACLRNPVTDTVSTLFKGYIDDLDVDMDLSACRSDVSLSLVDAFGALAELEMHPSDPPRFGTYPPLDSIGQIFFPATDNDPDYQNPPYMEVDARIHRALDQAGWPQEWRRIASGNVQLQAAVYERYDQLLSVIADGAEAEFPGGIANAYMSKDGLVCFHGRYIRFHADDYLAENDASRRSGHPICAWKAGGAPQAAADPTVALIGGLGFRRGSSDLLNAVSCLPQAPNITELETQAALVKDDISIGRYGWRSASYQDLLVLRGVTSGKTAVQECKDYSNYYVDNYSVPQTRITKLVFGPRDPRSFSGPATWELMVGVDIGDVIDVQTTHWRDSSGGFDERYYVEGIHYQADNLGRPDMPNVVLTLDVSPATFYDYDPFA